MNSNQDPTINIMSTFEVEKQTEGVTQPPKINDPSPRRSKAILDCFVSCLFILALVLSVVCCVINFFILLPALSSSQDSRLNTLEASLPTFRSISENLNTDPILYIMPGDADVGCPSGLSRLMLGSLLFKISRPSWTTDHIYQNSTGNEKTDGSFAQELTSAPIYNWGSSFFCVKRARPRVDYIKADDCPSGFKQCSQGICVRQEIDCPVTSVALTSCPIDDASQTYEPTRRLTSKHEEGTAPLINLEILQMSLTSENSNIGAAQSLQLRPTLSAEFQEEDGYRFDQTASSWIDTKSQLEVLQDNAILIGISSSPALTGTLEKNILVLATRSRLMVSNNSAFCQSIDYSGVESVTNTILELNGSLYGWYIAALVVHSILVITLCVAVILEITDYGDYCDGEMAEFSLYAYLGLGILQVVFYIIMLSYLYRPHSKMSEHFDYLKHVVEQGCFAEGPQSVMMGDMERAMTGMAEDLFMRPVKLIVSTLAPGIMYLILALLSFAF